MKANVIMCVRNAGDGLAFHESLLQNGIGPTSVWEVSDAPGMGAGYNDGLRKLANVVSPYDICIFTHQDVTMWAGKKLWGEMLETAMLPDVGFVGVAGSKIGVFDNLSFLISNVVGDRKYHNDIGSWWRDSGSVLGSVSHTQHGKVWTSSFGMYGDARVMDGVFLACKPSVLEKIGPWPEDLGWHFYDIWATERASKLGLRNVVVPLPLLHGSVGIVKADWLDSRDTYLIKYR